MVWLKSDNLTPTVFFPNIFNMGIKNAELDADIESVEKGATKFTLWSIELCVLFVHNYIYMCKLYLANKFVVQRTPDTRYSRP